MTSATDWVGRVGDVWASEWRRTDRSLAALAAHLDAAILAAAPPTGRALDIGCGAGATSLALARSRPALEVMGVDLSAELVAVARERAREGAALRLEAGDAPAFATAHGPFDLFFSRHGTMFFADPVAALRSFRQAAAPGTALVFSCFAERSANRFATLADDLGSASASDPLAPGPFAFADPDRVRVLLTDSGWRPEPPQRIAFGYRVGAGPDPVADAIDFLSRIGPVATVLRAAADPEPLRLALAAALAHYRVGDVIDLPATAWIWRAHAEEQP